MKPSTRFLNKKTVLLSIGTLTLLGVVAWSPPTNENVLVNPGSVQVRNGILEVKAVNTAGNTYGTAPAAILGSGNDILKTGGTNELGRGLVVGTSNFLSSAGGYGGVIGNSNNVWGYSSLVVGNENLVSNTATTLQDSTRYSVIAGFQNVINNNSESLLVAGKTNTVLANATLVTGASNTVSGSAIGTPAWNSAAIGQFNLIASNYGWTMGYGNTVSGSRAVAFGNGVVASNAQSTALGRFNSTMQSNDVLVVGTGTTDTTRSTALRVTSDGGVILGRVQGDVSMGIYGN